MSDQAIKGLNTKQKGQNSVFKAVRTSDNLRSKNHMNKTDSGNSHQWVHARTTGGEVRGGKRKWWGGMEEV